MGLKLLMYFFLFIWFSLFFPFLYLIVKISDETMDQLCTCVESQQLIKYTVIKKYLYIYKKLGVFYLKSNF